MTDQLAIWRMRAQQAESDMPAMARLAAEIVKSREASAEQVRAATNVRNNLRQRAGMPITTQMQETVQRRRIEALIRSLQDE